MTNPQTAHAPIKASSWHSESQHLSEYWKAPWWRTRNSRNVRDDLGSVRFVCLRGSKPEVLTVLWKTTLWPLPTLSMCVARLRQMARWRMASMVWASKKSWGLAGGRGSEHDAMFGKRNIPDYGARGCSLNWKPLRQYMKTEQCKIPNPGSRLQPK